jgi:hypothetical protein
MFVSIRGWEGGGGGIVSGRECSMESVLSKTTKEGKNKESLVSWHGSLVQRALRIYLLVLEEEP